MVLNGIGIPGRLILMYLTDRFFRPIHVGLPINLFTALLLFIWISIRPMSSMYVFAVMYGLFESALQGLFPSDHGGSDNRSKEDGHTVWYGFRYLELWCPDWESNRKGINRT